MKWMLSAPEIFYAAAALWFLALSIAARPGPKRLSGNEQTVKNEEQVVGRLPRREYLAALVLAAVGVAVCLAAAGGQGFLFTRAYRVDLFSQVFKALLSMGLFLVVCLCGDLSGLKDGCRREFFLLLFLCTLAMMLLTSANHLLSVYISLELSSYSLYILASLGKDRNLGIEAGMKYFLVGIFASAIMLFGMALLYAAIPSVYLSDMAGVLPKMGKSPLIAVGLLLTLCGFFFKLAVFPFHYWAPDVYQGAPNQVAAYIATASKVAAIAALVRIVAWAGQGSVYLVHVLVALSIVSMTLGNLAAIAQKDLKRLFAYSTVAHAGYILLGILAMNPEGYAAVVFYALAVLLMKFTVFLVIVMAAGDGASLRIEQLAGLHRRSPILALALMVALFGLAGIPPTIGFTGKFLIFVAAMEKGYFTLVLVAMVNVVISLYYYLLVIKAAYLLEPEQDLPPLRVSLPIRYLSGALVAAMLAAGFFPSRLIELAAAAARALTI